MDPMIRRTTLLSYSRSLKGFLFHFSWISIQFYRLSHSELDDIEKVRIGKYGDFDGYTSDDLIFILEILSRRFFLRIKQRWRWRHLVPVESIHHPLLTLNASKMIKRLKMDDDLKESSKIAQLGTREADVAAGAPEVAKGAPDIDEGAHIVLAPIQAPQPPPAAGPARTLSQKVARLSGVRYTSYFDFRIPYQRRVRRRAGEASTSAVPLDEDQPDP
ncbi:hypothetical protein Tco_0833631 [Tanacetum coccineum]